MKKCLAAIRQLLLGLITLFCLSGCAPQNVQGADPVTQPPTRVNVPFQVLLRDVDMTAWAPFQPLKQARYLPLTSAQDLSNTLNLHSLDPQQPFPPREVQQIDFAKEIGLYLTRGLKSAGGYTLQVTRVEKSGSDITVNVLLQDPHGIADSALHYRVTLLKIARADLPPGRFTLTVRDQTGAPLLNNVLKN